MSIIRQLADMLNQGTSACGAAICGEGMMTKRADKAETGLTSPRATMRVCLQNFLSGCCDF